MTFKDGGAFDFQLKFEQIKDTVSQAMELAQESGHVTGPASDVDSYAVHLDQLPAYEEAMGGAPAAGPSIVQPTPIIPQLSTSRSPPNGVTYPTSVSSVQPISEGGTSHGQFQPPSEPPPGYEETQQSSVVNGLEESVQRGQV